MLSTLKRKESADSDEPSRKRYLPPSVAFYASIKAWILCRYESSQGCFTTSDQILMQFDRDKENITGNEEGEISCNLLTRAMREVLGVQVLRKRTGKKIATGYLNLRERKSKVEAEVTRGTYLDEWSLLRKNITAITQTNDWKAIIGNECVSCIQVKNVRYDGQRVVVEILFKIDLAKMVIETKLLYHQRAVPHSFVENVLKKHIDGLGILEKARFLMSYLDNCNICNGMTTTQSVRHYTVDDQTNGIMEERFFSPDCQVLTNSGGRCCATCSMAKKAADLKVKRWQNRRGSVDPRCNHRYLSREQLIGKITAEKSRRLKAERLQERFATEMIEMEEADHSDLQRMMNQVDKDDVPQDMSLLWEQQMTILETSCKTHYRWHPRIMKLCIELYSKNPHVLDPLRKVMFLPSNRTIRLYKNKIEQNPGWDRDMLKWCLQEAKEDNLKEQDFWGGFVLDEMKIQEDIEMVVKNGKHRLVGFVDLGKIHNHMEALSGNTGEPKLATLVLQFIFVGDNGFRFPVAQFPSGGCKSSVLFFIFWEGVQMMREMGFMEKYIERAIES